MKARWVRYKKLGGPRVKGTLRYNPPQPFGPWTKIMGVVARCEGAHDTVVMYDETGVTFGFMQWTFKSGRLQKLLESFKSIDVYDFESDGDSTLFDEVCCRASEHDIQWFDGFGFRITGGKFIDLSTGRKLVMTNKTQRKRCIDICMGRVAHPGNLKKQKEFSLQLAEFFYKMGNEFGVADAQIHFAKQEFKKQLGYNRPPLGGKSINWLLGGDVPEMWEGPLAATFFNCWQNHPAAAYRLFLKARKISGVDDPEAYFQQAWKMLNRSKFANWGFGKPTNKSPRVIRIKKAIKEFYGIDLKYYK